MYVQHWTDSFNKAFIFSTGQSVSEHGSDVEDDAERD